MPKSALVNIRLLLSYDGARYLGWQKTRMGASIEETLERVLERIFQSKISLQAASRTDAGVHAEGQVVNFFLPRPADLIALKYSLNALLPPDIVVLHIEEAEETFHPTLDCSGKEYHYRVCSSPFQTPFRRFYSWHFPWKLDREKMKQAAALIEGERDFSVFCNFKKNSRYTHFVRKIDKIEIVSLDTDFWLFKIQGNHFLYKMARNIVGTLLYIGNGKIPLEELPAILDSRDRKRAGATAPAHGLMLHRVLYGSANAMPK